MIERHFLSTEADSTAGRHSRQETIPKFAPSAAKYREIAANAPRIRLYVRRRPVRQAASRTFRLSTLRTASTRPAGPDAHVVDNL